jgi:putative flippase GtrA
VKGKIMNKPIIIIPAYQPNHKFPKIVNKLMIDPDQRMIIVDDGSNGSSREIIDLIDEQNDRIDVIHHAVNLGKGQALKTGFNHFLIKYADHSIGVVATDANGRHDVSDILKVSKALQDHPEALILGSQGFDKQAPFMPRFANKIAIILFALATGVKLKDTQSGLRGIPTELLYELLHSNESGSDFELDMLVRGAKSNYKFLEIPIQDNHKSQNSGAYFNSLLDSFKLFFIFLRFSLISLVTAVIDYLIFSISYYFLGNILLSIILARLIAGTFQFISGKRLVFKSDNNFKQEFVKYILLVAVLMMLSYGVITPMVVYLKFSPYLAKIIAEATIFFLSFAAQNLFVFSNDDRGEKTNWDGYYNSPKVTSPISRKFTEQKLLNIISQYHTAPIQSICELGGGNSSFFAKIRANYPEATYIIIDNNQRGLDLFQEQHTNDPSIKLINDDVIDPCVEIDPVDLVFSVGLIEHFSKENTAKAIQEHFTKAKEGALVIITFPTPTWLYSGARFIAELVGAWEFPDERPLSKEEVAEVVRKYGEIQEFTINWPIIFTQGIIVARVNSSTN